MPISENLKNAIREIAFKVGETIIERFEEKNKLQLNLRCSECPTKQKVNEMLAKGRGVRMTLAAIGGLAGAAAAVIEVIRLLSH